MKQETSIQTKAYSVPQFCSAYSISRSKFYELHKCGDGPKIMKVGSRTLISTEAADNWRKRMELKT